MIECRNMLPSGGIVEKVSSSEYHKSALSERAGFSRSYCIVALVGLMLYDSSPQQDKLESVLDVSHQQMELYHDQPAHAQKISYQQRLLQEDLVSIRAQISRLSTVCMPSQGAHMYYCGCS